MRNDFIALNNIENSLAPVDKKLLEYIQNYRNKKLYIIDPSKSLKSALGWNLELLNLSKV